MLPEFSNYLNNTMEVRSCFDTEDALYETLVVNDYSHSFTHPLSSLQEAATEAVSLGCGTTLFLEAADHGCHLSVQLLINAGVSVNTQCPSSNLTALHLASKSDSVDAVKILIECGASEEKTDYDGQIPLHTAALHGSIKVLGHFRHLEYCITAKDMHGQTPLSIALEAGRRIFLARLCQTLQTLGKSSLLFSVLEAIINQGICTDIFEDICKIFILEDRLQIISFLVDHFRSALQGLRTESCDYILHIAAEHGTCGSVMLVFDIGNTINVPNDKGQTPLHLAVQNPRLDKKIVMHLATQCENLNGVNDGDSTILHAAARRGILDICQAIIELCPKLCDMLDEQGRLPLHISALADSGSVLDLLVRNTTNLDVYDSFGKTPVYYVLGNKKLDPLQIIRVFLVCDRNYSSTGRCDKLSKETILHVAAKHDLDSVCKVILEFDPHLALVLDSSRKMPLEYALKSNTSGDMLNILKSYYNNKNTSPKTKGHIRDTCINIVKNMIEMKSDCDPEDYDFMDVLLMILHCDPILERLLFTAAGAGKAIIVSRLLKAGTIIDAVDESANETALHAVIRNAHTKSLKVLIKYQAKEDVLDSKGNTPLHIAAKLGSIEAVELLRLSLKNSDIINAVNADGDTPIICAIRGSSLLHLECVEELLAYEPNLDIRGECGLLPINIAATMTTSSHVTTKMFCLLSEKTHNRDNIFEAFEQLMENDCFTKLNYPAAMETLAKICNDGNNVLVILNKILVVKKGDDFDLHSEFWKHLLLQEKVSLICKPAFESTVTSQNLKDKDGYLPLHLVAKYGSDCVFQMSIEASSNDLLNARTYDGLTVLHLAIKNERLLESTVLEFIKDKYSSLYSTNGNLHEVNIMQIAVESQRNLVIEALVDKCPLSLSASVISITPLHLYSKIGTSTKTFHKMLKKSFPSVIRNHYSSMKTPMHMCLENTPELRVSFLKECLEYDSDCFRFRGPSGESILHSAVKMGLTDVCEYLLSVKPSLANTLDKVGKLPLHHALKHKDCSDMLWMLLEHTQDLNGISNENMFVVALNNKDLPMETIKILISKGLRCCDGKTVANKSSFGRRHQREWLSGHCTAFRRNGQFKVTPVHDAVSTGRLDEILNFAYMNCNFNLVDSSHHTPLHIAVSNADVPLECIQALIENGAQVNVVGGSLMETPLQMALKSNRLDVCTYLLENGAEPCISDKNLSSPIHVALKDCDYDLFSSMVNVTRDLSRCNARGDDLLCVAVEEPHIPYTFTELLLSKGVDVNFHMPYSDILKGGSHRSQGLPSLLHRAVLTKKVEVIKLLSARKPSSTHKTDIGFTPVHALVGLNDLSLTRDTLAFLLDAGVDIDATDFKDMTALDVAALQGNHDIIDLLLSHGADIGDSFSGQDTLELILKSNIWTPKVVYSLIKGGYDLSNACLGCHKCDGENGEAAKLICSLSIHNTYSDKLAGYRLVFQFAVLLGIPVEDYRLEGFACGRMLGTDIQKRLCDLVNNPRPLTLLCRDTIRDYLLTEDDGHQRNIANKLEQLPVPGILKSFLKMEDLDADAIGRTLDVPLPEPKCLSNRYTMTGPGHDSDEMNEEEEDYYHSDSSYYYGGESDVDWYGDSSSGPEDCVVM